MLIGSEAAIRTMASPSSPTKPAITAGLKAFLACWWSLSFGSFESGLIDDA
jgi:hypothetical protein